MRRFAMTHVLFFASLIIGCLAEPRPERNETLILDNEYGLIRDATISVGGWRHTNGSPSLQTTHMVDIVPPEARELEVTWTDQRTGQRIRRSAPIQNWEGSTEPDDELHVVLTISKDTNVSAFRETGSEWARRRREAAVFAQEELQKLMEP